MPVLRPQHTLTVEERPWVREACGPPLGFCVSIIIYKSSGRPPPPSFQFGTTFSWMFFSRVSMR